MKLMDGIANKWTTKELRQGGVLEWLIRERMSVILTGPPGIGKTDVVRQVTTEDMEWDIIDWFRLSQADPVDLKGLPMIKDGQATFGRPYWFPQDPNWQGVVFLDEVGQGPEATQAAAMQVVLELRSGEHRLPDTVSVVAASNRVEDRAGVHRMLAPLSRRFIWAEVIPDVPPWCTWAYQSGKVHPMIVAFIRFRPALLHDFDPKRTVDPNPRAWEKVSRIVSSNLPVPMQSKLICGTVGEGPTIELEAFRGSWTQIPNLDAVLLNPATHSIPTDMSVRFAVAGALASRADRRNVGAVLTYAERLGDELAMFVAQDMTARDETLASTQAFTKFGIAHQGLL